MGKKLVEAKKLIDPKKFYQLDEAIELAKKTSISKFDGSIDLAFKLNVDVRKSEQQLRGSVVLPHGSGKTLRVLVATDSLDATKEAKEAKADLVVNKEELTEILQKEKFDFDILVADPKMMPLLGKFGKVLGPKNLMPNPKLGTVTANPGKIVNELKKGKANYRTDKAGIVHVQIGKVSFSKDQLVDNAKVVLETILRLKPNGIKGKYIQNFTISATMGASVKIDVPN